MNKSEFLNSKMKRLRNEELVQIALSRETDGFEDEYIQAARNEIEQRGIQSSDLEFLSLDKATLESWEDAKADEPLGIAGRIIFFVFSAVWFAWLATAVLKYRGYEQKFRDAWRWIFYGWGLFAAIGVAFMISDISGK